MKIEGFLSYLRNVDARIIMYFSFFDDHVMVCSGYIRNTFTPEIPSLNSKKKTFMFIDILKTSLNFKYFSFFLKLKKKKLEPELMNKEMHLNCFRLVKPLFFNFM